MTTVDEIVYENNRLKAQLTAAEEQLAEMREALALSNSELVYLHGMIDGMPGDLYTEAMYEIRERGQRERLKALSAAPKR